MAGLRAAVATEQGSRYLQQLCKHWSHRFAVEFDPAQGIVHLNGAVCRFQAAPHQLVMTLDGADDLERMSGVVTEHLKRFAFREELAVEWVAA
jgi:hypothetical protein